MELYDWLLLGHILAAIAWVGGAITMQIMHAWSIGQLWIILALVGIAISAIGGALFFGPQSKRIAQAFEAEGAESERARALIRQLFVVSRIDVLTAPHRGRHGPEARRLTHRSPPRCLSGLFER
ncbi:MAG: hypothetical protein ACRDIW_10870 [Actinomycetota bacterium]